MTSEKVKDDDNELRAARLPRNDSDVPSKQFRILNSMGTEPRVLPFDRKPAPEMPRGAQCPNCFTYNLTQHRLSDRAGQSSDAEEMTCLLCGTRFPVPTERRAA